MYALCVSGAVNTQGFVWMFFFYALYINFHSFIHSDISFKKLNSLHRRTAKLMLPDPFTTTEAKIQHLGLLPLREKLIVNKAVLVFKACRNLAPQYLHPFLFVQIVAPHEL